MAEPVLPLALPASALLARIRAQREKAPAQGRRAPLRRAHPRES